MKMYAVDARLEKWEFESEAGLYTDPETGEILSYEDAFRRVAAQMTREEQIESLINSIKNLNVEISARKDQISLLTEQKEKKEFALLENKKMLMNLLTNEDGTTEKYKTPLNTVYVRENKPSVVISDEALLPMEFKIQKIEMKADKASIKEVLHRGIEVPGARLERTRSVIIK